MPPSFVEKRISELEDENAELQDQLDAIGDIVAPEDVDEEDTGEGDEEDDRD